MRANLLTFACFLAMAACTPEQTVTPPAQQPPPVELYDGFVSAGADLRHLVAIVRVTPPDRLRREFETTASRSDDPDIATFLRAVATGGFGSGFVVVRRRRGERHVFVVTNRHVVEDSADAEVGFGDGPSYAHCPIVYVHPTADLALLELPASAPFTSGLAVDATSPVDRETVIATGYPALGNAPSFQTTEGKISNAAFEDTSTDGRRLLLIQHTAPIDPGSSGGPLTNEAGRIVGVNVSMARGRQNANFAVPASELIEAVDGAIDVLSHIGDAAYLSRAVMTSCNRLAAELTSKSSNGHALVGLLGMDLLAYEGPPSFLYARTHTPPSLSADLLALFTRSPLDAYRVAIGYRMALRASVDGGIRPGAVCSVNPSDAANIVQTTRVRVSIPTRRGAMELVFGLERGTYRVAGGDL